MPSPDTGELDAADARGQLLGGRYELLGLLGVGGMGSVYRAHDRELDEIVALKMLRRELVADDAALVRFRQEVKLARRVTHKNVARTFDIGQHEGEKFLTMELIEGETLGALLARERRLTLARVTEIADAVCGGLSAAHAAGVVHRDLKPDNVLLAKDGRIVITDFGVARAVAGIGAKRTSGLPVGTPAYMAPEQVEGAADVDARADIYALGAMLFELVTGAAPWEGSSVIAVATMRLTSPPPDPRARVVDLPDAFANLILRCMARHAADRYASAADVAAALACLTLPAVGSTPSLPAHMRSASAPPARPSSTPFAKTVAVLPFRNGGGIEDDYLADGLTEDLIDTLSMGKGLRVRARGAVIRFKGVERDARELGRDLEVQVVVEGSLRRVATGVRVSVRLISVADGFQLWAKRFDCSPAEVLAVGDDAANAIADALTLSWHAPAREMPTDPRAIDLYLRARHEQHKGWRTSTEIAAGLLRQALTHAPSDPRILSALAAALARQFAFDPEADNYLDEALACAERALAVAPHLGEAHAALASLRLGLGDNALAAAEAKSALASAPGLAEAHELIGRMLIEAGRPRDGMERMRRAMALEPMLVLPRWDIVRVHELQGEHETSDAMFAVPPTDEQELNSFWLNRWRITLWRRDVASAKAFLERLDDVPVGMRMPAGMIFHLIVSGTLSDFGRHELNARAAQGRSQRRRAFFRQHLAECLAYANDPDGALEALEDADRAASFDVFWLDGCPLFEQLRAHPRFTAVRATFARRADEVLSALAHVPP